MVLALAAAQKRDFMRMRLWLLATAMLGMTFVGGQVYEFTAFYREGLAIDTNLFGTTFFVLTGFHGVHVTVGILMLLSLTGMSFADRLPDDPAFPVEMVGPVLALRRHRVDHHLHGGVPDPHGPGRELADGGHPGRSQRHRGRGARVRPRRTPERAGVRPHRLHPGRDHRRRGRALLRPRGDGQLVPPGALRLDGVEVRDRGPVVHAPQVRRSAVLAVLHHGARRRGDAVPDRPDLLPRLRGGR